MTPGRFVVFWAFVSAVGALAVAALIAGARSGNAPLLVAGVLATAITAAGIAILARAVWNSERARREL